MRISRLAFWASLLPLLPASALAEDAPKRKPGLWEIQSGAEGQSAASDALQTCVGPATDDMIAQVVGGMRAQCSKMETRKTADGFVISSVCKLGQTTATTEGTITGSFDSAYRADMQISYDPPVQGMAKVEMVMRAKWLGLCKEGQKAGDIVIPSSAPEGAPKSVNVEDSARARGETKRKPGR